MCLCFFPFFKQRRNLDTAKMKDNKEARLYKIFVGNQFKDGHSSSGSQSVVRKEKVDANKTNMSALGEALEVMKTPAPFATMSEKDPKEKKDKKEKKDCTKSVLKYFSFKLNFIKLMIYNTVPFLALEEKTKEEESRKAAENSVKLPHP